jgi:calcineurin-like phosphoesterase family protein
MAEKFDHIYNDGSKLFFTSDTHANHGNIIDFCNRPFADSEEMDRVMVERWNEKVPEDGIVFHLGDFAWGGYNVWKKFRDQLNGRIVLIKGNHDMRNLTSTAEKELFELVTWQLSVEIEGRRVLMNHYPFLCYAGTYRDQDDLVYQLHGHTHFGPLNMTGKDNERLLHRFPTQYDVGVDGNGFAPVSWHEVDAIIREQIRNYEPGTGQDHTGIL